MSGIMTQQMLISLKSAGTVTRTFQARTATTTDLTEYTYSGAAIGTAASDRKVVVGILGRSTNPSTRTISSVTVAGVSATQAVYVSNTIGNVSAFYVADVPTGTTGDVVVTWNDTMQNSTIGVYAMYGAASSTPHDTATDIASAYSQTLDIPAKGVGFACGAVQANTTATWAGLTEDADATTESELTTFSSAEFATLQTGLTISMTQGSGTDGVMSMCSFGP